MNPVKPYLKSTALQTICLTILEVGLDNGVAAQGLSYTLKIFVSRLSMTLALIPQRAIPCSRHEPAYISEKGTYGVIGNLTQQVQLPRSIHLLLNVQVPVFQVT
jgi:hypothetical protein